MLKRIITGIVCTSFVIYILTFSPAPWFYFLFALLTFFIIFMASTEFIAIRWNIMDGPNYVQILKPKLTFTHYAIGFTYAFPIVLYAFCRSSSSVYLNTKNYLVLIAWLFFTLLVVTIYIYKYAENIQTAAHKLLNVMAGFIYIGVPGLCLLKMVEFDSPIRGSYIYFVLATIHMGDVGAYFIGTKFGKHKLVPKISPTKSVEGSIAGLFFSAWTAVLARSFFALPFGFGFCILLGVLLGLSGQLGDLMESAFKRAGGFKDSGNLLPGHGGFLDRVDSLFLGVPIAFILISFIL